MAILWVCPSCRTQNSLARERCRCGTSFSKTKKRRFVVHVRYKGLRKTASAPNLTVARELEAKILNDLIRVNLVGETRPAESLTLREFYRKRYRPWAEKNIRFFDKVDGKIRKWVLPELGDRKLDEISPLDVEGLKGRILAEGRSPRTVEHVLALLRAVLNRAREWGFMRGDNPVSRVKFPRFDNRRVRFLSREEARRLLEECRRRTTPRNLIYPMVLLALTTGMRAGEIFRLRVQDVDFRNDLIHIRDPKSGENRVVFFPREVREELRRLVRGKKPHEFVFTKPDGRSFREVPDVWESIVRDLGFNEGVTDRRERVVFHTLRHTFCSWLAMEGTPLHVIKELAGHKTIQMTERYAHLLPDVRRKAAEKVWRMALSEERTPEEG